jgi:hypothetical protein
MGAFDLARDGVRPSHRIIGNASFQPFLSLLLLVLLIGAQWRATAQCSGCADYGPSRMWTSNTTPALTDASGLAVSAKNPGVLWSHNDSGGDPLLFALNTNGLLLAIYDPGADSLVDFEDMAIGPGPLAGAAYLYIGDIGVGGLGATNRESVKILRVLEPDVSASTPHNGEIRSFPAVEVITLGYPDGAYDADAMLVDPLTGDVFIGAKQAGATRIYRANLAGVANGGTVRLELVATTTLSGASGGAISADGSRVVLRNERNARLWFRCPGESVGTALARSAEPIPLVGTRFETNGEAIAFLPNGSGYVTLSDSVVSPPLFFFPLNCSSNGVPPSTNGPPADPLPPPVTRIVAHPQGATVEPGSHVELRVSATGQNLKYQWRRNGAPFAGAETDTLVLAEVQPENSGAYNVLVIGDQGTALSDPATIVVRSAAPEPVILIAPESRYVPRGGDVELTVHASGEEPLSYTWTLNGRWLSAAGPTLQLPNAKRRSSGYYRVSVANAHGVAETEAEIQVLSAPSVRVTPRNRTARLGATVVLRAVARGAQPLEYQWQFEGANLPGENGSQLVLHGVDESFAGLYTVKVTNPVGFATAGAVLRVR